MTSQLSIVKKMNTFLNKTIHIMPKCVIIFMTIEKSGVLLHLRILKVTLNFTITSADQLMTFIITVSHLSN
jgi:hypothetical protein